MNKSDAPEFRMTGNAVLVAAHHDTSYREDRNFGMVLNIEYLGAALESIGWSADLICGPSAEEDLARCLEEKDISFVGISSTSFSFRHALSLARVVRGMSRGTPVLLGGVHASIYGAELLRRFPELDVVSLGEGEPVLEDLVSGRRLHEIHGIAFRENGRITETPGRDPIKDLDRLPYPLRGRFRPYFRLEESFGIYNHIVIGGPSYVASVLTTRGCNHHCTFCRSSLGSPLRSRSVSSVTDELEELASQGVGFINFVDSNFLYDRNRFRALAGCLRRLKFRWICQTRPESLNEEVCRLMVDSGCVFASLGVESLDPGLRRLYGKGQAIDAVRRGLLSAKNAGLQTRIFMIVGPVNDLSYFNEEIEFLMEMDSDFIAFGPLHYRPGTALWNAARGDGRIAEDYTEMGFMTTEIDKTFTNEEFSLLVKRIYRRFYYRPGYLLRQFLGFALKNRWPGRRMTGTDVLTFLVAFAKSFVFSTARTLRRVLALCGGP